MEPENFFLKYAFPCSWVIYARGEISLEEYNVLKEAALEGKKLSRDFLEKVYFRAFERLSRIAEEMNKDKWDMQVIEEYFRNRHNSIVELSEHPQLIKEFCKVYESTIKSISDEFYIVKYGLNKERKVKKVFVPNANIGDRIRIHYDYAIEKVN